MPVIYNDSQHWRDRANEACLLADKITEIDGHAQLLAVAEEYDLIAERAEQRLKTGVCSKVVPAKK